MVLTFDEVMSFDKRNRDIYNDLVKQYNENGIIPFVGAGLSVAAGFKTWENFLDYEYQEFLEGYTRLTDPLDAASELSRMLSAAHFRKDIVKAFGGEYTDTDWHNVINNLRDKAVGLLPKLFNDVIVTTNYDRLLEHLYPTTVVSHPGHDGQLNRALHIGTSMIFKLHGCVSNPEEIILTRESYERVYENGASKEATRALEKILTGQAVLFLGCSLKDDYTVKHWSKMITQPEGIGIEHFTIIGCNKNERQEKRRQLGDMNIFPILYDINNHDAVRVVLYQMYLDTHIGDTAKTNLPQRNSFFSGRVEQLKKINALFSFDENTTINICQTVSGLGGIGKTQLAIEYAYCYFRNYKNCVWFINAETETTAQSYFTDLANVLQLSLPPDFNLQDLQCAIKEWLSDNKGWLLILDNLEAIATINPYLPQSINGQIIITTRNTRIDFGSQIVLGVFSVSEAILFMKKRLSSSAACHMEFYNDNYQDFDEQVPVLISRLGFLPLALEQAVAYIKEVKCTITKYLKLLDESGLLAFEEKQSAPKHYIKSSEFEKIVTATWNISFQAIACEGSRQLLNLCAYMAPDKIPVAFFTEMREMLPSPLRDDLAEEMTKNRIVTELRIYSLTSGNADYINIHRLVQEVIRKSHAK